jgi:hypothetical protein
MKVRKIQAGFKITPLSEWGKTFKPPEVKVDPSVDMKTPSREQVDTMPVGRFFAYAAELMGQQPPHVTDQPNPCRMKKLGIEPGKPFDIANADPIIARALDTAPEDGQKAHGLESADRGPHRQRLVYLAGDHYPSWPRREPTGRRDLSVEPR